jgi:TonB family protein
MRRGAVVLLVVAFATSGAAETPGATGPRIVALARLALTPGSPESQALLRSGLLDENPSVRSAAARVVHVKGESALLPEVRAALSKEKDADAALEEAWVLGDLDGTDASDSVIVEAVAKPDVWNQTLAGFAAGRGPRLSSLWGKLRDGIQKEPGALIGGLERGLHQDSGTMLASYALRDGMEDLVEKLLLGDTVYVERPIVMVALSSASSRIRSLAYLYLADLGADLKMTELPERKAPESLEERVTAHLFEASQGPSRTEKLVDLATLLKGDEETARGLRAMLNQKGNAARGLSAEEREILYRAAGFQNVDVERASRKTFRTPPSSIVPRPAASTLVVRSPAGHPPDFVRSVLEATDCKGAELSFDGTEVTYLTGGRPGRIALVRSNKSARGCGEAAQLLGATSVASGGNSHVLMILPERPEFLACLAETAKPTPRPPASEQGARVGGSIKEPTKIRNVPPVYPDADKVNRVQGMVILEATIRESGCVSAIKVLKGVETLLDLSAIDAVSGWRYSQTLIHGIPVPVIMTVTVNFRLN